MKIGFVIYGSLDTVSGGYLYDRKLVEYLRAQGDTVEVISLPWRNYIAHLTDNFQFRLWRQEKSLLIFRQQAVGLQNFDIIIQDELNHPSLIGANRGQHPCPIVSLVHHLRCSELRPKWQNDFYRIVEKKYLQSTDGFIFNSKTTKGVVNDLIGDNTPSLVAFPPTDRFRNKAITEEEIKQRTKTKDLRILFLGNVIYRKGLHTLLKAITSQKRCPELVEGSKIKVDVVGGMTAEPTYTKDMQQFVAVNGLSSIVNFHKTMDSQPLIEMYKQAHVMIVPSSYEGFGIVYLEGMGFGLPAIGTTAGAASEIITHGKDGYLIKPDDSETLAKHIHDLATDRELLVNMSLNAMRRFQQQPAWNETAKSIRDFLLQMIS